MTYEEWQQVLPGYLQDDYGNAIKYRNCFETHYFFSLQENWQYHC